MSEDERERPDPEDDPFVCSICAAPLGTVDRIEGEEYCDGCKQDAGILPPVGEGNAPHQNTDTQQENP